MSLSSGREIGFDTERRFSPISYGFALLQTAINWASAFPKRRPCTTWWLVCSSIAMSLDDPS